MQGWPSLAALLPHGPRSVSPGAAMDQLLRPFFITQLFSVPWLCPASLVLWVQHLPGLGPAMSWGAPCLTFPNVLNPTKAPLWLQWIWACQGLQLPFSASLPMQRWLTSEDRERTRQLGCTLHPHILFTGLPNVQASVLH